MKLAIIGSRDIKERALVENIISQVYVKSKNKIDEIITGGAKGVDKIAEDFAKKRGIKCTIILPNYKRYQRSAPIIRNNQILQECNGVLVIWDGKSKGTEYTINKAKREEKKIFVVKI